MKSKFKVSNLAAQYLELRNDPKSSFGYGLMRRTNMLLEMMGKYATGENALDVIDFGCAEGAMLLAAAAKLDKRFQSGLGVDVFRSGVPQADTVHNIRFAFADLFRYPLPIESESRDVAIISAFLKHHPSPASFLREVSRILRSGGCAIVLDPRPWVVNVGFRVGRFNPEYNPSLWSLATIKTLLAEQRDIRLDVKDYRRYWVAPTPAIFNLGVERILPANILHILAMHQCVVLTRI